MHGISRVLTVVVMAVLVSVFSACSESEQGLTATQYVTTAKMHHDEGDLRAAQIALKNALQMNPKNLEARWLLGQIYLEIEQGAEAEKELVRAKELGIEEVAVRVPLGQALALQGEWERVLNEITPLANSSDKDIAVILRMHGDAKFSLGEQEDGCQLYKDSIATDASHVEAYWGLANCAYMNKNPSEARALIEKAFEKDERNAGTWLLLGDFERASNNDQAAIEAYSSALKYDPNKIEALFHRAVLYIYIGEFSQAQSDIDRIKMLSGDNSSALFATALLHYAEGESEQALDAVQKVTSSRPDYLPAMLLLGQVLYEKKDYEQTVYALTSYLRGDPGHGGARKLLASTYIKLQSHNRALEVLEPFIDAGIADSQMLSLAGDAHLQSADPHSAEAVFESSASLIPTNAIIRTKLGLSRLAVGKEDAAIEDLKASSAMDEQEYKAEVALIYYYFGKGEFDNALAVIVTLEKKLPDSPGTYNLKGLAYVGKKDYGRARMFFEKALALKPDLASAAVRLAAIDLSENNIPAARGRYQSILKHDDKNVVAMVGLAELAALEKNESNYLDWLTRAAEARPSSYIPRAMIVDYHLGKGDLRKALTIAHEVTNARSNDPQALALLGRVQLAAGEMHNATITYSKLVQMAPKSSQGHYHLAKAHAAAGNEEGARAALRQALELDPRYADALVVLVSLEARAGNYQEALNLAQEFRKSMPDSPVGMIAEGDVSAARKDYEQAANAYKSAFEIQKNSGMLVKLHRVMIRAGNADEADNMVLDWLKARPQDDLVRSYLAQSYTLRKLNRRAIDQYETLLGASSNKASILNNLSVLYRKENDSRAQTTAEKAYKLQPDNPEIADTLGWILIQENQIARGLQLIEKAAVKTKDPEVHFHLAYALAKGGHASSAQAEIEKLLQLQLKPELERQVRELQRSLSQ